MTGWNHVCKLLVAVWLFGSAPAVAGSVSETRMYAGDVEGAVRAASQEAKADATDVEAQERYLDILLTLGLFDKAVERQVSMVGEHPTSADAQYLLGRAIPTPEAAREAYERALRIEPTHARSHMGMGAIHTALGRQDQAIAAYGLATEHDPSLAEAWQGLARAHLAKGDRDAALAVARRAVEAAPTSPDAYLTVAVLDPSSALKVLEKGVKWAGVDPRVHGAYAEVLLGQGKAGPAVASADRGLAIDPTEPMSLRAKLFGGDVASGTLGLEGYRALLAARDDVPADFESLVADHPRSALPLLGRSRARLAESNRAGALADLQRAAVLAPDEPEVQGAYGMLLLEQGKAEQASHWLGKASAARPWDGSLGLAYGQALTKGGEHDKAIATLKVLSQRRLYDTDMAIAHADALLAARQPEAAYQVVLAAAELQTDSKIIVALVAVATQVGRYDEAAEILEEIGRSTNNASALDLARKLREKAQ